MKKRLLCLLLAFSMGLTSVTVAAEDGSAVEFLLEEMPVAEEPAETEETEEQFCENLILDTKTVRISASDLLKEEEQFAGYVEKLFYEDAQLNLMGIEAGKKLKGDERLIYKKLMPYLKEVANGERSDTCFRFGKEHTDSWTGKEYLVDEYMEFSEDVEDFDLQLLVDALMSDLCYELYWFGGSMGVTVTCRIKIFFTNKI